MTRLTPRQTEIMDALVAGGSSKSIGSRLGISARTVDAHVRVILLRLHARSRTHAVSIWLQSR